VEHQKTICVDLDGVLAKYDGWKGPENIGELKKGAKEGMEKIRDEGWLIVIWTTRERIDLVEEWLEKNNIPYDYINKNPEAPPHSQKAIADVYLDDRAIRFENWSQARRDISEFMEEREES